MSRIEKGVPFEHYLPREGPERSHELLMGRAPKEGDFKPGAYTVDPNFKMPTVKEPPEEPATPPGVERIKTWLSIDPGSPNGYGVLSYRKGDKVTIINEVEGWQRQGVIGGTLADGVQYRAVRNFDESHIVRGYN